MHGRAVVAWQKSVTDHLEEPETLLFRRVAETPISECAVGTSGVTDIKIAAARMFMAYFVRRISEKSRKISGDGT